MIKLGLTGGIGSGKTTIAKVFQELGASVYYADVEAKKFLAYENVKKQLVILFGEIVISAQNEVDKMALAAIVFTDPNELAKLNALIHPLLEKDFEDWIHKQNANLIVKEAAILFEAGFDKSVDKILTISAPVEERIARVIKRDGVNKQQVLDRISKQWTDEQREAKSDYVIRNANDDLVLNQIIKLYDELSK